MGNIFSLWACLTSPVAGLDIIVEPGNIEQGEQPEPGEEKKVGKEEPGEAEQGGGDEEPHPEEDGEGLQPPLEGDRERGELDPQNLHFYKSSADCPAALAWDRFSLGNNW